MNRNTLQKLISESIKKHLLREWGDTWNYPGDSDFRSDAPWNQSEPEIETEEKSETFPTIPLVLVMLDWSVGNEPGCWNLARLGLTGCPEQVEISAEYEYEMKDDGPDEDGLSSWYRDNEERTSLGIYVNVNGKWMSFIDWALQVYKGRNDGLLAWLKEGYEGMLDLLNDNTYTADDFDNEMEELKSEVNKMAAWCKQTSNQ